MILLAVFFDIDKTWRHGRCWKV